MVRSADALTRVSTCGVYRTDLHVCEGDLAPKHPAIIPGHEIVGVVEQLGPGCRRLEVGARVGVAWLRETCETCVYCRRDRENLCPNARFTGWDHDGGYAEFADECGTARITLAEIRTRRMSWKNSKT